MLIVLIYQQPGRIRTFIADLMEALLSLPVNHGTVVLGDFNIDQKSQGNVTLLAPLIWQFGFIQQSKFRTCIHWGMQDLAHENNPSANPALCIPTPFSDHFVVLVDI